MLAGHARKFSSLLSCKVLMLSPPNHNPEIVPENSRKRVPIARRI
jgi:hypothetical protein